MALRKRLQAFAAGLKELDVGHPPPSIGSWWVKPAGYMDTRSVGDGTQNSIVIASLNVLSSAFSEAPPRVFDRIEGEDVEVEEHPAPTLLESPNPYMTGELLWSWVLWVLHADGNAFLYKARNGAGEPVELWPLRPDLMTAKAPTDGSRFIDSWTYRPGMVSERSIPVEDVIHLRLGMDPEDFRLGYAPLKAVLREVLGDEEASQYAAALLRNMAVPGVILTPNEPGDPGPSPEEADAIKDEFRAKFGGSKRGEPMVVEGGAMKVNIVSFSPEQMDLRGLRRVPEERISAVLGVPAVLAGLGAGLDRATYANVRSLREFLTEQKVIPLWRLIGQQLSNQLLFDFADSPTPTRRLAFDVSEVRALAEDAAAVVERMNVAITGGWATVAEGRRAAGLEAADHHDYFLRSLSTDEVPDMPIEDEDESAVPTADELAERIGT